MYPSLYYLFADLFGIHFAPLKIFQMFGCMVAVAYLTASYIFSKELKRKEKDGLLHPFTQKVKRGEKASVAELIEAFIIGAFGGLIICKLIYIFQNQSTFGDDPQSLLLSRKGINIFVVIAAGAIYTFLKYRDKEKHKLPEPELVDEEVHPFQLTGNVTLLAAGAGLAGAKLFDGLENYQEFFQHPIQSLLSFSGLTVYGGLIVGSIAILYYIKKKGLPLLPVMDAAAPAMMIGYSIGRIGCQLSGDGDWGIANSSPKPGWMSFLPDWMWAFNYPHNVIDKGVPIIGCADIHCSVLEVPVFPTPFYETFFCAILFFILWGIRKKIKIPGILFCIYLMMNGVERFFIELIRVNIKYTIFGMQVTQAQIIAPLFFLLGLFGIYYFRKKAHEQPATS